MEPFITVNDILDDLTEENKRLSNELIFAKKFLKILIEFKSFVDLNFNPIKHNFDSNVLQKFNDFNKDIEEKLKQKSNILSDNSSDVSTNNFRKVIKPEDICLTINSSHGMKYNEADNPNLIFNEEQPECSDIAKGNKNLINKKVYNKVSNEIRDLIIRKMDSGLTGEEVGQQLDQKPSTVRRIYRHYKQNGIKYQQKGHRNERLSEEQKQMIIQWIENDCQLTLKDLQAKCLQEWPELISIGTTTIHKALKSFHYSFKQISPVLEAQNTPEVIEKRRGYVVCDVAKGNEKRYKRYKRIEINSNKVFVCDFIGCGKVYSSNSSFRVHLRTHDKKYICNFEGCSYRTGDVRYYRVHTKGHLNVKPFKCRICGKGYPSLTYLKLHTKSIHDIAEQPLICDIDNCNKSFKNKARLNMHKYRTHIKEKHILCDFPNCEYKTAIRSELITHQRKHSTERPFKCEVEGCVKTYKTASELKEHLESHSSVRNYKCLVDGCNKCFKNERALKTHFNNNHSGIKYQCDWPGCEFESNFKSSIRIHSSIHNSDHQFQCHWPQCTKSFKTKLNLKRHSAIHINDKKYVCSWPGCQYRCVFGGNLNKHMRVHRK